MNKPKIKYHITPSNKAAHLFHITINIAVPNKRGHELVLPAWIPGSYMIRDFAKNIVWLKAFEQTQQISVKKLDKQTWRLAPTHSSVVIKYEVYAWDLSVRTAHLDMTHGYFNGASVLLQVRGFAEQHCDLKIDVQQAANDKPWMIATGLAALDIDELGHGIYRANNYSELIDCPVEMGCFDKVNFRACGVPHELILTGHHNADVARLVTDLQVICEYHIHFFGAPAPMDRYVFLVMIVGEGYGGLEHRNSTSLLCSRNDLPRIETQQVTDKYRNFLALCSHEYFHTWNVKRIRPAVFEPLQLATEIHTELLWWFEGVTSYYDELALVRSGLISEESYFDLLGQNITRVIRQTGRFKQSIAESSFDAWTKFYKQDENAPNAIVSYYTKGALFAFCLDIFLRRASKGKYSLDNIVQGLWDKFLLDGQGIAERVIEKFIKSVTGVSVDEFFERYLYDVNELPLDEMLQYVGLDLKHRVACSQTDLGGKPSSITEDTPNIALGIRTQAHALGIRVTQVFDLGSAQKCGIAAGDILLAFNKLRVTNEDFERQLQAYNVDDNILIDLFRRDELISFTCSLQAAEKTTCYLVVTEKNNMQRSTWLTQQVTP